jgi:hypothetical protein
MKDMKETNGQTWPPPPAVGNPLAAHDAFLAALVLCPSPQFLATRTRLARLLHRRTGLGLRQCRAVVHDFCERHSILPQEGIWARLPLGLAWASLVVVPIWLLALPAYLWMHAHTAGLAARLALDNKFDHLKNSVLDPWLNFSVATAVAAAAFLLPLRARLRREAEDARRKLTVVGR